MLAHVYLNGGKPALLHQGILRSEVRLGVLDQLTEQIGELGIRCRLHTIDQLDELVMRLVHGRNAEVIVRIVWIDQHSRKVSRLSDVDAMRWINF